MIGGGTDLDRVLVGKKVDDLKCMRNNANCHELLSVITALHHQAEQTRPSVKQHVPKPRNEDNTHLSTNRSTIGICAFLNCFLA